MKYWILCWHENHVVIWSCVSDINFLFNYRIIRVFTNKSRKNKIRCFHLEMSSLLVHLSFPSTVILINYHKVVMFWEYGYLETQNFLSKQGLCSLRLRKCSTQLTTSCRRVCIADIVRDNRNIFIYKTYFVVSHAMFISPLLKCTASSDVARLQF